MVNHTDPNRLSLSEALKLREQANELLNRLIADREQSERRLAETGKRDPMKFVTGQTALEGAISSTRDLIVKVDDMVNRIMGQAAMPVAQTAPTRPSIRVQPVPALRNPHRPAHAVAIP